MLAEEGLSEPTAHFKTRRGNSARGEEYGKERGEGVGAESARRRQRAEEPKTEARETQGARTLPGHKGRQSVSTALRHRVAPCLPHPALRSAYRARPPADAHRLCRSQSKHSTLRESQSAAPSHESGEATTASVAKRREPLHGSGNSRSECTPRRRPRFDARRQTKARRAVDTRSSRPQCHFIAPPAFSVHRAIRYCSCFMALVSQRLTSRSAAPFSTSSTPSTKTNVTVVSNGFTTMTTPPSATTMPATSAIVHVPPR